VPAASRSRGVLPLIRLPVKPARPEGPFNEGAEKRVFLLDLEIVNDRQ